MKWFRLGIWVALAAGFYILVNEVLQNYAFYEEWRWHIYKILIGGGALLAFLGKRSKGRVKTQAQPGNGNISFKEDDSDSGPDPVFTIRYCGCILTTFGIIVRVVIPMEEAELKVAARAEETQHVAQADSDNDAAPTTFPELRLQGVACSKVNPSALINRKTYFVGDMIDGARVASILQDSIVLEKNGANKTYLLKR